MAALLLPSNLDKTTLGDVLGVLLRGRATGFLELGDGGAKSHVFLSSGRPTAVASTAAKLWPSGAPQRLGELLLERGFVGRADLERAACARVEGRLLGELLLDEGALDQRTIEGAMAAQTAERLDRLELGLERLQHRASARRVLQLGERVDGEAARERYQAHHTLKAGLSAIGRLVTERFSSHG